MSAVVTESARNLETGPRLKRVNRACSFGLRPLKQNFIYAPHDNCTKQQKGGAISCRHAGGSLKSPGDWQANIKEVATYEHNETFAANYLHDIHQTYAGSA